MKTRLGESFSAFSSKIGFWTGHPLAFVVSCALIAVWALSGPIFGFSDTWQLVVNTATTVITYLLVFVIQNTQNRNAAAIHLKLDELLRANPHAETKMALADLENASDATLRAAKAELERRARESVTDS